MRVLYALVLRCLPRYTYAHHSSSLPPQCSSSISFFMSSEYVSHPVHGHEIRMKLRSVAVVVIVNDYHNNLSVFIHVHASLSILIISRDTWYRPNVPAKPCSTLRMYNANFISFSLLSLLNLEGSVKALFYIVMERLFSPCTRYRYVYGDDLRRHDPRPALLQELRLDVPTDELLGAERGFTYADLYYMP
jgi:hypothetical protein